MSEDRTVVVRLTSTLSTNKARYQIAGGSFRASYKNSVHTVSEVNVPANGSFTLFRQDKMAMIGTESTNMEVDITKDGATITLPLDQTMLLPGSFDGVTDTIVIRNTSQTTSAIVRYIIT